MVKSKAAAPLLENLAQVQKRAVMGLLLRSLESL